MPPPYRRGNWFHSRSSSSEGERDAIITLVKQSKLPEYTSLRWSGDKTGSVECVVVDLWLEVVICS